MAVRARAMLFFLQAIKSYVFIQSPRMTTSRRDNRALAANGREKGKKGRVASGAKIDQLIALSIPTPEVTRPIVAPVRR